MFGNVDNSSIVSAFGNIGTVIGRGCDGGGGGGIEDNIIDMVICFVIIIQCGGVGWRCCSRWIGTLIQKVNIELISNELCYRYDGYNHLELVQFFITIIITHASCLLGGFFGSGGGICCGLGWSDD